MRKIPTLFTRDPETHLVTDEVTPGCEWVFRGEGIATEKFDGTACLVQGLSTGRVMMLRRFNGGWCDILATDPNDVWHVDAFERQREILVDGTYELVGPKIQGNPYGLERHELWRHGSVVLEMSVYSLGAETRRGCYEIIRDTLEIDFRHIEGIVWHHKDGRMAKIKRRDFGLEWPVR